MNLSYQGLMSFYTLMHMTVHCTVLSVVSVKLCDQMTDCYLSHRWGICIVDRTKEERCGVTNRSEVLSQDEEDNSSNNVCQGLTTEQSLMEVLMQRRLPLVDKMCYSNIYISQGDQQQVKTSKSEIAFCFHFFLYFGLLKYSCSRIFIIRNINMRAYSYSCIPVFTKAYSQIHTNIHTSSINTTNHKLSCQSRPQIFIITK